MGVSGEIYHRLASEADGWGEVSDWYGAKNRDKLMALRRTIPHNKTNLSPTWSLKAGRMFHRQGAKAWTYIEYDDVDMVEARMAAIKYYMGSVDGKITCRSQFSRPAPDITDLTSDNDDSDAIDTAFTPDGAPANDNDEDIPYS
jgi:hypothetical protein